MSPSRTAADTLRRETAARRDGVAGARRDGVAGAPPPGRRRGRRALLLLAAAVVALGALLALGALRTELLDTDDVDVVLSPAGPGPGGVASSPLTLSTVLDAVGPVQGRPLLTVDTSAVARAVEADPHVARATVARDWPGALRVEVAVRVPVAVLARGGEPRRLVDADGTLLPADDEPGPGTRLPEVRAAGDGVEAALTALAALPPDLRSRVAAVQGPPRDLRLELLDATTVRLGGPDALERKGRVAAALVGGLDAVAVVDVRAPTAATVRARGPVTAAGTTRAADGQPEEAAAGTDD